MAAALLALGLWVGTAAAGGSEWAQLGGDVGGAAAGDWAGWALAMAEDGARVAVGAPKNDGNGTNAGHVRVYEFVGASRTWVQLGGDIDGEAEGDGSGGAVALSSDGSRVAIGAARNDGNGADSGQVRVYEFVGASRTWVQLGGDIDGEAAYDNSGGAVSLSSDGSRVAIGAPRNAGNGADSGHVRVYEFVGASRTWVQLGGDIDSEAAYDNSGEAVSLSSDGARVAIGATRNAGNGTNAGHVRVYEYVGASRTWVQLGGDLDGEAADDRSGGAVALSSDGSRVAIGAYRNADQSGHVRVYELPPPPPPPPSSNGGGGGSSSSTGNTTTTNAVLGGGSSNHAGALIEGAIGGAIAAIAGMHL